MAGIFVDTTNLGHNTALTQDVLYGLDGNDQLLSSEATLYAEGGRGNDFMGILNNPTGTVELYGGQGSDTIFGRGGALDKLYGGDGDDWLVGTTALVDANGTVTPQETSGVDYMEGGAGSDGLYGFDGNDELYGGGGNDKGTIQVADVNTYLNATLHPVKAGLFAGDGNDEAHGGAGDDEIHGGNGTDMLWGDGGADEFHFDTALSSATNVDTIKDFSRADGDRMLLSTTVFDGIGPSLTKGEFTVGNTAKDGSDHIIYNANSGKLFHDADGKGGEAKTLFAILDKHLVLNHTDFLMV